MSAIAAAIVKILYCVFLLVISCSARRDGLMSLSFFAFMATGIAFVMTVLIIMEALR